MAQYSLVSTDLSKRSRVSTGRETSEEGCVEEGSGKQLLLLTCLESSLRLDSSLHTHNYMKTLQL